MDWASETLCEQHNTPQTNIGTKMRAHVALFATVNITKNWKWRRTENEIRP